MMVKENYNPNKVSLNEIKNEIIYEINEHYNEYFIELNEYLKDYQNDTIHQLIQYINKMQPESDENSSSSDDSNKRESTGNSNYDIENPLIQNIDTKKVE